MLAVRRPSNHAFARGGDGVDREGHLLTFADLGRDRGSFDWLSQWYFPASSCTLNCVIDSGIVPVASLTVTVQVRSAASAPTFVPAGAVGPWTFIVTLLPRSRSTRTSTPWYDRAGRWTLPVALRQWSGWGSTMAVVGTQLLGRGTGVGRCRGRVVGEGTACEQACCSTQSEHGNLATDPTDAGAAPSSGRGATTHVLPVQWWRCQVRVSRAAPMTARPVSIEAWLSDTGSTVPSAPVRGRLGLPDREG